MDTSSRPSLERVTAEAIETLTAFSIPLYKDTKGRPTLWGSGFLVNAANECFLVSAAHVLDDADSLYFYSTPQQTRRLDGHRIRSGSLSNRLNDRIDIGVVRLGPLDRPPYPDVQKFAMDASYLKPHRVPRAGRQYVMIGYPETKNRFRTAHRDVIAAPYAYRAESIAETEYAAHGLSAETHVVLPLDLRKGFDPAGRLIQFPKPQGMSGSPVVVLHENQGDQARVFPVVAVAIEYRKSARVVVATDVSFVLEAIQRAWKEAATASARRAPPHCCQRPKRRGTAFRRPCRSSAAHRRRPAAESRRRPRPSLCRARAARDCRPNPRP